MNKINTKSRNKRPECGANAPTFLSTVYKRGTQAKKRQAGAPQYGRSMIEMLGVLAIIGVLSVGGIMGYSKAMMRYKINKTIENITYVAGNVRTAFASQGNYEGVSDNDVLKKAHIFPDDMWDVVNNEPQGTWDGSFELHYVEKNSSDINSNKAFRIYCDRFPVEACIELVSRNWGDAQMQMIEIYSNGSHFYVVPPVSIDEAVTICKPLADRPDWMDEIYFYFDIDTSDPMYKNPIDETTAALAGN